MRKLADGVAGGRIVETEAYPVGDAADHACRGITARNRIDRGLDGIDLCAPGPLWLGSDGHAADAIGQSKRIGITRAADRLLRFYVRGNSFVSGPRALNR